MFLSDATINEAEDESSDSMQFSEIMGSYRIKFWTLGIGIAACLLPQ